MKRPVFIYDTDACGNPTGKLLKRMRERPQEKRGTHCWVSACDKHGNEVFGYCGLCGRLCEDKTKISSKLLKKLKRVV